MAIRQFGAAAAVTVALALARMLMLSELQWWHAWTSNTASQQLAGT